MIVCIYLVTGIYGTTFWDTGILTFTGLETVPWVANYIPNKGLNEAFMAVGGVGLAFNIITSYMNVFTAKRQSGESPYKPLLYLLPFPASVAIEVFWLSSPSFSRSHIINSPLFLPFLCAWGLQFAHQVGRMILAHVTKQPFPWWDTMWLWSIIGAVDANMPLLFNRAPLIQHSPENVKLFVWTTLAISLLSYAWFCTLVINDITNYLGIACFTVRKKDDAGHWQTASVVDNAGAEKKQ